MNRVWPSNKLNINSVGYENDYEDEDEDEDEDSEYDYDSEEDDY